MRFGMWRPTMLCWCRSRRKQLLRESLAELCGDHLRLHGHVHPFLLAQFVLPLGNSFALLPELAIVQAGAVAATSARGGVPPGRLPR